MKVLCFGNPLLEEDSLAIELADELKIKGFEFIKTNSVDDILNTKEDFIIMDVAKGIDKVTIIKDINKLISNKIYSMHDFDLNFFLKLMKEKGEIDKIMILALPMNQEKQEIKKEVLTLLPSLL
jgi:Ni,Fe-hydrogenase maturation factor